MTELMTKICANITKHEGRLLQMYLDSKGYVTCGVGHALFTVYDALSLEWLRYDHTRAENNQIIAAWTAVKSKQRQDPQLFLAYEESDYILAVDLNRFTKVLFEGFPEIDTYPEGPQIAMYDIAFNCGSLAKWPKLSAAVKAKDWNTAASESYRPAVSHERNIDTANQFLAGYVI